MSTIVSVWKRMKIRKQYTVPAVSVFLSLLTVFPSFAAEGDTPGMTSLLGSFTEVAAWMWKEIGLLLSWILDQPILLLAMSLFFVGAVVSFFIRVFHSV